MILIIFILLGLFGLGFLLGSVLSSRDGYGKFCFSLLNAITERLFFNGIFLLLLTIFGLLVNFGVLPISQLVLAIILFVCFVLCFLDSFRIGILFYLKCNPFFLVGLSDPGSLTDIFVGFLYLASAILLLIFR